jgi:ABC-type antimicrobial peptide transport system permease subunit
MYFLHHTDELGFSFDNSGSILVYGDDDEVFSNRLQQIPEITEVIFARGMMSLLPTRERRSKNISLWDDKSDDAKIVNLEIVVVSPEIVDFYDFRLIAGEMLTDVDPDSLVLLNESAVKAFGWYNPLGKQIDGKYTVKGVIKNVYNFAPTVPAKPVLYSKALSESMISIMYSNTDSRATMKGRIVLFKYHKGLWKSCREKIDRLKNEMKTVDNIYIDKIVNAEEEFGNYLKSEAALMKLLSFVSVICVLICVFGFVSLVSLTCEERRKEIAIRKINGATSDDILSIFAKEYFRLLLIGSVIAFTTGYFIMQRWLEHYVKQTGISVWVYLMILFVMVVVIVLCVGWQVFRSSIENPAEIVKID